MEAENASEKPVFPSENSEFWLNTLHFERPSQAAKPAGGYVRSARVEQVRNIPVSESNALKPPPRTPPPIEEPITPLEKLSSADRTRVEVLISMGASELKSGISSKRLKKAFRRLAKRLHPDGGSSANPERFMLAKDAYDGLCDSLEQDSKSKAA